MILDPTPGRDAARELAREELTDPGYAQAQPSPVVRLLGKAVDAFQDLFARASSNVPGGRAGLVVVLLLVLAAVAVVLVTVRPARRGGSGAVFGGAEVRTAVDHRREGDRLAAAGQYAEAVRERLRAVVRELEARGVLDPRPGRTADEVAQEAGRRVPDLAAPLRRAATTFDEVWYGGRSADQAAYTSLVEVDEAVRATRAVVV